MNFTSSTFLQVDSTRISKSNPCGTLRTIPAVRSDFWAGWNPLATIRSQVFAAFIASRVDCTAGFVVEYPQHRSSEFSFFPAQTHDLCISFSALGGFYV